MNAAKIDAFGFTEAASRISTTGLIQQVNQISEGCRRSAALLRILQFRLLEGGHREANIHDVEATIGAALDALPVHDGDAFNAIDDISTDVNQAVRDLVQRQQNVAALLDAMEVAASMGSTLDEITEAATTAYSIVTGLPDGQRHWDAFCELIVRRGLSVELIDLGPRFGPRPKINTPETLKHSKAVQRKIASFTAAVHEEAAARDPKRKPAKRNRGKA